MERLSTYAHPRNSSSIAQDEGTPPWLAACRTTDILILEVEQAGWRQTYDAMIGAIRNSEELPSAHRARSHPDSLLSYIGTSKIRGIIVLTEHQSIMPRSIRKPARILALPPLLGRSPSLVGPLRTLRVQERCTFHAWRKRAAPQPK
jgi:hypothetical protein